MRCWPQRTSPLQVLLFLPCSVCRCAGRTGSQLLFAAYVQLFDRASPQPSLAASRTVFSTAADDHGRTVRSPDALRPLTSRDFDCKILTTALCFGLRPYPISCIHPSQRCVTTRQMTDNVFQIETAALAHGSCMSSDCGVFLTDSACPYPSADHGWIFRVLYNAGHPGTRPLCDG